MSSNKRRPLNKQYHGPIDCVGQNQESKIQAESKAEECRNMVAQKPIKVLSSGGQVLRVIKPEAEEERKKGMKYIKERVFSALKNVFRVE